MLGICRGLQVVNVALGGTLVQDIPIERPSPVVHQNAEASRRRGAITTCPSRRARVWRRSPARSEVAVNSRHHQAIARVAPGLAVLGDRPRTACRRRWRPRARRWLVAVQWHPENLTGATPPRRASSRSSCGPRGRARVNSGAARGDSVDRGIPGPSPRVLEPDPKRYSPEENRRDADDALDSWPSPHALALVAAPAVAGPGPGVEAGGSEARRRRLGRAARQGRQRGLVPPRRRGRRRRLRRRTPANGKRDPEAHRGDDRRASRSAR